MTEQELREKIVKILEEYRDWFIEEDYKRDIVKIDYTGIADALVAEGIGDVMEWKERAENFSYAYNACGNDLVEMEHRAEVAERALKIADKLGELCGRKEDYVQQAERELAEEGEDE